MTFQEKLKEFERRLDARADIVCENMEYRDTFAITRMVEAAIDIADDLFDPGEE
jgi:hypothetical protein